MQGIGYEWCLFGSAGGGLAGIWGCCSGELMFIWVLVRPHPPGWPPACRRGQLPGPGGGGRHRRGGGPRRGVGRAAAPRRGGGGLGMLAPPRWWFRPREAALDVPGPRVPGAHPRCGCPLIHKYTTVRSVSSDSCLSLLDVRRYLPIFNHLFN